MEIPSEIISGLGIIVSMTSLIIAYYRSSKAEVKELEHRLTSIEEKQVKDLEHRLTTIEGNQFNAEDKECLHSLDMKMGLLWGTIERDFPRLLTQTNTLRMDTLLKKATNGVKTLSKTELKELDEQLRIVYEDALSKEEAGRAMAISLYRGVLNFEMNNSKEKTECQ